MNKLLCHGDAVGVSVGKRFHEIDAALFHKRIHLCTHIKVIRCIDATDEHTVQAIDSVRF